MDSFFSDVIREQIRSLFFFLCSRISCAVKEELCLSQEALRLQNKGQSRDKILSCSHQFFVSSFWRSKSIYGRSSGKTSNPPWPKENGAGDKQMQFHTALQDSTEDTGPSVFNPTPVEHGTKEDAELKQ